MCYKFLLALMLILVFLQYFYTYIGTGFVLPRLYFMSRDNSTLQHAPLFSAQDNDGTSYTNDVKNLTAWLYHQKRQTVGAPEENFKPLLYHQITTVNAAQPLPLCPLVPPNLVGVLGAYKEGGLLSDLETQIGKGLLPGGQWRPSHCKARDRVAIIIPYRDRTEHLSKFLANMHPFLQRQLLDYGIFVIEQYGNDVFNRAMLLNVGFVEALAIREFDCFIFHDVDLLPEDDRNLYTCPDQPRHMSAAVDVFNYRLPYADIFGGVSAMSKTQFEKVNGFSNKYWGWGGEDDDMAARIKSSGLHITRYPPSVARYTMLSHTKQKANPKRYETLYKGRRRMRKDGLNSLKYRKVASRLASLFTFETLYQGKKRMKVDGLNSLKYRKIKARLTSLFTWVLVELNKV